MSKDSKPIVKWSARAAIVVSLMSFVAAQLVLSLILFLIGWDVKGLSLSQTYLLSSASVLLPAAGIYLYLRKTQASLADVGLAKLPKPFLAPVAKTFGLYLLFTTAAVVIISSFAPSLDLNQAQELGLGSSPVVWHQFMLLGLLLVVFTPLSEELLFRGFMLKGLAGRFGWHTATVATSLLFGLAHGQLNVAIDTAIMGWFSAQLVIKTESLWPSIALHALKNIIAFTFVYLGPLL